ncbi:hypothetical protein JF66_11105 [Cryobacterium sp. MLB-32]|uniref:haloacid dehalogenase type II n=1 Tax=Cryobacterium sp. MLB-32 TaxID=1529318 RepID=UPI0004E6EEF8|nr:haloacid dehalogenase type II [Cryobacterium sp. MLB-32]KFF59467.1 hypothetical protein JF66_11105 [Cryobacterium sp. MLB-32]
MTHTPTVIVFDVNETLSDMRPLQERFTDIGAPAFLARIWFAALLRDGFALAAAGGRSTFAVIGAEGLRSVLRDVDLNRGLDDSVRYILDGFAELSLHPDVVTGLEGLSRAGFRLVTLSNGAARVAETLLTTGGVRSAFEAVLTVEDAPAWKPAPAAYAYAADACGVPAADMLLVAVHPWDIHGAARAGLRTAWLNRTGEVYPSYFAAPDFTVRDLSELANAVS